MIYVLIVAIAIALIVLYSIIHSAYFLEKQLLDINELINFRRVVEAKKKIKRLPKSIKNDVQVLFANHKIEDLQKNYRMALYYLNEIELNKKYNNKKGISKVSVNIAKINILEKIGNKEEVVTACKKLLLTNPSDLIILKKIADNLFEMKNQGAAKPYLKEAIRNNSKNYSIYKMFAKICIHEKNYNDALKAIDKAINLHDSKNCKLMEIRLNIIYELGYYDEVIQYEKTIDESFRRSMQTRACIALSYLKLEKVDEAFLLFTKFLDKHINNYSHQIIEARYSYSHLLSEKNEHKKAMQQLVMVNRSNQDFRDAKQRYSVYENIFSNPRLLEIVSQNDVSMAKEYFNKLLKSKYHTTEMFLYVDSSRSLAYAINNRENKNVNKRIIVLINYSLLPLSVLQFEQFIQQVQEEFKIYKKIDNLHFYSFYHLENEKEELVKEINPSPNFVIGQNFFNAMENKALLPSIVEEDG